MVPSCSVCSGTPKTSWRSIPACADCSRDSSPPRRHDALRGRGPGREPQRPPTSSVVVSALTGSGLDQLLAALRERLPEGPFHYDPDAMATQPMRFFAAEFVREAAFELLHEELPYSVAVEIDEFREGQEPVYIRAVVYVERASQKGIVIGEGGRTIKAIGQTARGKIEVLLGARVFLELHAKVLPKWRRQLASLKRLGYAG